MQTKNRDTVVENKHVDTREKVEVVGWMHWETDPDYAHYVYNGGLMRANCATQGCPSVLCGDVNEKEAPKRGNIYICIWLTHFAI